MSLLAETHSHEIASPMWPLYVAAVGIGILVGLRVWDRLHPPQTADLINSMATGAARLTEASLSGPQVASVDIAKPEVVSDDAGKIL